MYYLSIDWKGFAWLLNFNVRKEKKIVTTSETGGSDAKPFEAVSMSVLSRSEGIESESLTVLTCSEGIEGESLTVLTYSETIETVSLAV